MELASITAYKIVTMFVMVLIGVISYRTGIISKEINGRLSNFLLLIISPLMMLCSYQRDFSSNQLMNLLTAVILAAVTHVIAIIVSMVFIRKKGNDNYGVEAMAVVYSNCGFMGIPLINGIFGAEGVFYVTAYITMFNVFAWTHGVLVMIGKQTAKNVVKALCTPTIFAIMIGLVFYVARIRLPKALLEGMEAIANMNTPMAMVISGVSLASSDLKNMLKKKRIYYICFLRLFLIPLVVMAALKPLGLDPMVTTTIFIASACPVGSMGTLFALRYEKDSAYASEMFGVTTVLSLLTLPLMVMVYGLL